MPGAIAKLKRISPKLILIIAIAIFLFFCFFPTIRTPSLDGDEAYQGCNALGIIHNKTFNNIIPGSEIILFGRRIPLTSDTNGKHGSLECLLLTPALWLGGSNFLSLRITPIITGVFIILLTYYVGSSFFNVFVGCFAALLMVLNPAFVDIIKIGAAFGFSLPFLSLTSLICFFKYYKSKKPIFFILGMFILALGFMAKMYFTWFILLLIIIGGRYFLDLQVSFSKKLLTALLGVLVFMFSAAPLIYFYVKIGFFKNFLLKYCHYSIYEINNFDIINNFIERTRQLTRLLMGDPFGDPHGPLGIWGIGNFRAFFFYGCVIFLLYRIFVSKQNVLSKRKILFVLFFLALGLFFSSFTVTAFYSRHLFIFMPYIFIIMGIAMWELFHLFDKDTKIGRRVKPVMPILVLFISGALIISCVFQMRGYYRYLLRQEEEIGYCDAPTVANWLMERGARKVLCFDFWMTSGVPFFSNFQITPLVSYLPKDEKTISWAVSQSDKVDAFIVNYYIEEQFKKACEESHKNIVLTKAFSDKNGNRQYLIFQER